MYWQDIFSQKGLITRYILKFTKIETYGKNLIKIGRFQMTQYIGCPMEKACLA
jgi:hypothetical protein